MVVTFFNHNAHIGSTEDTRMDKIAVFVFIEILIEIKIMSVLKGIHYSINNHKITIDNVVVQKTAFILLNP